MQQRTVNLPEDLLLGEQVTILPAAQKAWRKERKLSQQKLAVASGCSEGLISTIESGHRQASITVALRIAKALDVPLTAIALVHIDLDALASNDEAA